MRNLIFTCLLIFLCITTRAQTIVAGIKGGYNLSRLEISGRITDPVIGNDWIPSFHVGAFLRKPVGAKGAVQVELLYSGKGCRFQLASLRDNSLQLHYLNLPVLLNFQIIRNLVFEVGPELGYLLGTEQRVYNKFDLGADVGLRYDFGKTASLGARYCHGLASVTTFNFTTGSNVLRNQALQVSLAYNLFK